MRKKVVLPAPFRPRRATRSPRRMERDTPRSASTPGPIRLRYTFRTSLAWRASSATGRCKRRARIKLDSESDQVHDCSEPDASPPPIIANAACRFDSFSCSLILTVIETDQMWPNGSWSLPYRSPQNWFSSGNVGFAPALRAWFQSLSTSFEEICRFTVVDPADVGDFESPPGNSSDIMMMESPILIVACINVPSGIGDRSTSLAPKALL